MQNEYKQFYRRKLPHRHSPGGTLFVTFRLKGSIPKVVIEQWRANKELLERELSKLDNARSELELARLEFHRQWFARFERLLDRPTSGPLWLKDPDVARVVFDSLIFRNGRDFDLFTFCIMANHVHVLFKPLLTERSLSMIPESYPISFVSSHPTLGRIMQSLKGYTARQANAVLNRTGPFWDVESYDHEVRNDEEFYRIKSYILNNPVKAGLVRNWRDWPWSYDSTS